MREWVKGQLSTVFSQSRVVCVCVVVVNTPPQRSAPSGFLQKPFALPCPKLNCTALCALAGTSSSNSVCV